MNNIKPVDDLKLIKRYYGEGMMHFCREMFPTLLETKGLLYKVLTSTFERSKFLYDDIITKNLQDEFIDIIYSRLKEMNNNKTSTIKTTTKSPEELLDEAGYILYECRSEEDIQ